MIRFTRADEDRRGTRAARALAAALAAAVRSTVIVRVGTNGGDAMVWATVPGYDRVGIRVAVSYDGPRFVLVYEDGKARSGTSGNPVNDFRGFAQLCPALALAAIRFEVDRHCARDDRYDASEAALVAAGYSSAAQMKASADAENAYYAALSAAREAGRAAA